MYKKDEIICVHEVFEEEKKNYVTIKENAM